jgi:acylaminoacyl-peptidase
LLAGQGYILLYTNPRGSLGRHEDFATCIQGDWGNLDYEDLKCTFEAVEKLDYIDPERMAILGGSYGGFMVTWILGHTNRFCCAISERGVSNRHSAIGTTDFSPLPDGYWPGNTWDQPEQLWAQSPLRFAGNIHTPLLIIHSEGDLRCPIGQAEQLFTALKRLNREVTFLRYPSETSHALSRNGPPDLRMDRLGHITNWLEQYFN